MTTINQTTTVLTKEFEERKHQVMEDMASNSSSSGFVFDDTSRNEIMSIVEALEPIRSKLLNHPLYSKIDSLQKGCTKNGSFGHFLN